jgi:hypothetical protein
LHVPGFGAISSLYRRFLNSRSDAHRLRQVATWPWYDYSEMPRWRYPELCLIESVAERNNARDIVRAQCRRQGYHMRWRLILIVLVVLFIVAQTGIHFVPLLSRHPQWVIVTFDVVILFLSATQYRRYRRHYRRELRRHLAEDNIRLCRECGYDLRGLIEPRCPECGESFDMSSPPDRDRAGQE